MDVLASSLVQGFEERQTARVRERYQAIKDPRPLIQKAIQLGSQWEIEEESDVADLIDILAVCGEDFTTNPEKPWIAELLESKESSGFAKVRIIATQLGVALDAEEKA